MRVAERFVWGNKCGTFSVEGRCSVSTLLKATLRNGALGYHSLSASLTSLLALLHLR